jgi:hypothetical protein
MPLNFRKMISKTLKISIMKTITTNQIWKMFIMPFFCLMLGYSAESQNVILTTSGHPRIFLNPAKVNHLRALSQEVQNGTRGSVLLNDNLFPATGSMSFELFVDTASLHPQQTMSLFDEFDGTRNHIFLRMPYAGVFDTLQLALHTKNNTYAAAKLFGIKANNWNRITLGWNTTVDSMYYKVEYYSANKWNLFRSSKFKINDPTWVPDQQNFTFKTNGYIDNIAVYSSYIPSPTKYLAKFNMEKQQGFFTVIDSTANQLQGVVKLYGDSVLVSRTSNNKGHSIYLNYHSTPPSKSPTIISQFSIKSSDYQADVLKQQMATAYNYIQSMDLNSFKCSSNSPCRSEGTYYRGVINTAFMWQVTGDIKFRDKAIAMIDTILTGPRNCEALSTCGINDQVTRTRIMAMGLLYDWMYNDIDPVRRTRLVDSIKTSLHYDYPSWGLNLAPQLCGSGSFVPNGFSCAVNANPSYLGGHSYNTSRSVLIAVLAVIDAAPEFQPLLNKLSNSFKTGFDPVYEYVINKDGGHPMGYAYGTGYDIWDATYLLNQLTTDKHKITWPANSYKRFLYGIRGYDFPKLGDDYENYGLTYGALGSGFFPSYPIYASRFNKDGVAQYFNEFVVSPFRSGNSNYGWFYDIVFGDSLATPVSYTTLPLAKKFSVSGLVSCRDNWDIPNTALLNFKSSNFIGFNHVHADNNSFELFYKSPLLIDAGYYDSYGTPQWVNYYTRTIAHNAVTVYNPLQTALAGGGVLDGGQLTTEQIGVNYPTLSEISPNGSRWIDGIDSLNGYDHHTSQDYTYFKGDATKAYPKSNVKQSVREIIYTRNGVGNWQHPLVFIFDKVKSVDANFVKRVHWHMINKPVKTKNRYTIVNGKAYLDILYPAIAKDTLIGGPGHNFWVDNPVTGAGKNYNLNCPSYGCDDTTQAGVWRIDVKPSKKDTLDHFLQVIAIDDASGNKILVTSGGSTTKAVYAIINNNLLVSFSRQDTAISNLTINAAVSFTDGIITGLKPNSKYQVFKSGNTLTVILKTTGTYTASNAGVVYVKNISVAMGMDEVENINRILLYPSPCNDELSIAADLNGPGSYQLSIINVLGQMVLQKEFLVTQSLFEQKIETASFERGIYFLSIKGSKGENYLQKFIKE